jgi:hypothetical protein
MACLNPFTRICGSRDSSGDPCDESIEMTNPVFLESESARLESLDMLQQLRAAEDPLIATPDTVLVNFGAVTGVCQTALSDIHGPQTFRRLQSSTLDQRQGEPGLAWTESRKLLEAAIAVEQVEPQPLPDPSLQWREDLAAQEYRLYDRLNSLGLDMVLQFGDGNCQFRSLSWGLFGTPQHHGFVRRSAVEHMKLHRSEFEAFLGEDFKTYAREMQRDGTWGDELTLRAACESYGVVVNVVSSDASHWFVRYVPSHTAAQRELFLAYVAPVHYNALRRKPRGFASLRSLSSLGRRNSRIVRALDQHVQRGTVPSSPATLINDDLADEGGQSPNIGIS